MNVYLHMFSPFKDFDIILMHGTSVVLSSNLNLTAAVLTEDFHDFLSPSKQMPG